MIQEGTGAKLQAATAAGELRLESSEVRVRKRRDQLEMWFLLFSPLLWLGLGYQLALAALAFAIGRIFAHAVWWKARPALILATSGDGGELVIKRGRWRHRVDKTVITECWKLADRRTGRVRLLAATPRSVISIQLPDRASADALTRALGRDGLLVTAPGRTDFIGFERVRAISQSPLGIIVTLSTGKDIRLSLAPLPRELLFFKQLRPGKNMTYDPDNPIARRQALARRIDEALARFRAASKDGDAAARLLDRGPRPIPEWREALSRDPTEPYRELELDADQLVNVLENPKTPIGQRLGAALALGAREHQARARAAIASSANPKLRALLEKAAEGSLDDADYERALEAEAEAERELTGIPRKYQPIRSD